MSWAGSSTASPRGLLLRLPPAESSPGDHLQWDGASVRARERQPQLELGAATKRAADAQLPVMRARHPLHDVEAQAAAAGCRPVLRTCGRSGQPSVLAASGIHAVEPLAEVGQMLRRDARSVILDPQPGPLGAFGIACSGLDAHAGARARR